MQVYLYEHVNKAVCGYSSMRTWKCVPSLPSSLHELESICVLALMTVAHVRDSVEELEAYVQKVLTTSPYVCPRSVSVQCVMPSTLSLSL